MLSESDSVQITHKYVCRDLGIQCLIFEVNTSMRELRWELFLRFNRDNIHVTADESKTGNDT